MTYKIELQLQDLNLIGDVFGKANIVLSEAPVFQNLLQRIQKQATEQENQESETKKKQDNGTTDKEQ